MKQRVTMAQLILLNELNNNEKLIFDVIKKCVKEAAKSIK